MAGFSKWKFKVKLEGNEVPSVILQGGRRGWHVAIPQLGDDLGYITFSIEITPPNGTLAGTYPINFTSYSAYEVGEVKYLYYVNFTLKLIVEPVGNVKIIADYSLIEIEPNGGCKFTLKVRNYGNAVDDISVTCSRPSGEWYVHLNATILKDVEVNGYRVVEVTVIDLIGHEPGTELNLIVTATSHVTPWATDSIILTVRVIVKRKIGIEALTPIVKTFRGEVITLTFRITNLGNYSDIFDLWFSKLPLNWIAVLDRYSVYLNAHESVDVRATIQVPETANFQPYIIEVSARSRGNPTVVNSSSVIVNIVIYDLISKGSIGLINASSFKVFDFFNDGSVELIYKVNKTIIEIRKFIPSSLIQLDIRSIWALEEDGNLSERAEIIYLEPFRCKWSEKGEIADRIAMLIVNETNTIFMIINFTRPFYTTPSTSELSSLVKIEYTDIISYVPMNLNSTKIIVKDLDLAHDPGSEIAVLIDSRIIIYDSHNGEVIKTVYGPLEHGKIIDMIYSDSSNGLIILYEYRNRTELYIADNKNLTCISEVYYVSINLLRYNLGEINEAIPYGVKLGEKIINIIGSFYIAGYMYFVIPGPINVIKLPIFAFKEVGKSYAWRGFIAKLIAAADINADGCDEILVVGYDTNTKKYVAKIFSHLFTPLGYYSPYTFRLFNIKVSWPAKAKAVDVDGNGDKELVVISADGTVSIVDLVYAMTIKLDKKLLDVASADINADGEWELLILANSSETYKPILMYTLKSRHKLEIKPDIIKLKAKPGEVAHAQLIIRNLGFRDDLVAFAVIGVPRSWIVVLSAYSMMIPSGGYYTLTITFQIPENELVRVIRKIRGAVISLKDPWYSKKFLIEVEIQDVEPPSPLTGLTYEDPCTGYSIKLMWNSSIDNGGIVKYLIYRNGTLIERTAETQF
ncbi:MAG: hypothetical protein DRJ21_00480, partial [Candidatus Methanomethylicota archaeon]